MLIIKYHHDKRSNKWNIWHCEQENKKKLSRMFLMTWKTCIRYLWKACPSIIWQTFLPYLFEQHLLSDQQRCCSSTYCTQAVQHQLPDTRAVWGWQIPTMQWVIYRKKKTWTKCSVSWLHANKRHPDWGHCYQHGGIMNRLTTRHMSKVRRPLCLWASPWSD